MYVYVHCFWISHVFSCVNWMLNLLSNIIFLIWIIIILFSVLFTNKVCCHNHYLLFEHYVLPMILVLSTILLKRFFNNFLLQYFNFLFLHAWSTYMTCTYYGTYSDFLEPDFEFRGATAYWLRFTENFNFGSWWWQVKYNRI